MRTRDRATRSPIDRYVLYGDPVGEVDLHFTHVEPIRVRSGRFDWTIAPHSHAELHQILLVADGGGAMRIDASVLPITPPTLMVVPAGTVHAFDFAPDTDGWVGSFATGLVAQSAGDDPAVLALWDEARAFDALDHGTSLLVQRVFAALSQELLYPGPARGLAIRAELLRLLVIGARLVGRDGMREALVSADAALTERFRQLIEQEFRQGLPISAYARKLGVSEDRLLAACRRRFGEPPIRLIHRRIVLEAKRWLFYTRMSVGDVGRELGFADAGYFSRFLKRVTGKTPTQFRAQA